MPRVSVIIPTFNCARFLERSLNSAFAQTYPDYEVIVADDGSTDHTGEMVARYNSKLNYLYQPNRGLSAARNLALSKSNGEFIAYLDADDMWYPHKLERQVAFLDAHKECGIVHSDFTEIDETDRVIHRRFNQETREEVPPQGHCELDLLRRCHIQIPTVIERRDCIQRIGKFDERLKGVQDYLHWILVAMDGTAIGYIDEPLAMYRRRAGSLSSSQRWVLEDLVVMIHILLDDKHLGPRCGQEAASIVRDRLYTLRRDLAYLDRIEGHPEDARRRLLSMIWEWPLRAELYLDLLKSVFPPDTYAKLRRLRAQAGVRDGGRS